MPIVLVGRSSVHKARSPSAQQNLRSWHASVLSPQIPAVGRRGLSRSGAYSRAQEQAVSCQSPALCCTSLASSAEVAVGGGRRLSGLFPDSVRLYLARCPPPVGASFVFLCSKIRTGGVDATTTCIHMKCSRGAVNFGQVWASGSLLSLRKNRRRRH